MSSRMVVPVVEGIGAWVLKGFEEDAEVEEETW